MKGKWGFLAGLVLLSVFVSVLAGGSAGSAAGAAFQAQMPGVAPGDWPMYGHDLSRTNYNPDEVTINAGNVNQIASRWQQFVGNNGTASSSSPSVSGGRVFVGSSASSGPDFFAFDAFTGSLGWSISLTYTNSCFNVGIGSSPAISGTLLSVGGGDSAFYGINANTGAIIWRNPMNLGSTAFPWESPLLAYGRSYLGMASRCDSPSVRGEVRAVDMNTGSALQSQYFVPAGQAGGGVWNSPALSPDGSTLVVVTGEDYAGYNGQYNRAIVSLDPISLAIIQSNQQGSTGQDLDYGTTPLFFSDSQGRTLVGANHKNGVFYAFNLNSISSGPIWSRSTGTDVGMMPAYDPTLGSGGTLFIAGSSSRIFAVDPATGLDRWPAITAGTMHGNMALANGLLFVNTGSSGLKIYQESNGALLRTLTPANAGATNSGVAVSNGFIYWVAGSYLNAWSLPAITPTPTNTATATVTSTATNIPTATPTDIPTLTPTSTPTALLVGHVTWQGRPAQPNALQQLPISLTLRSGANYADYPSTTTDASGFFTVSVASLPKSTYVWRAKGPQYLANSGTVDLLGGTTQAEMGLMRTGDANNDNVVNGVDFVMLRATIGKACGNPGYDSRADFNGDCVINGVDFTLMKNNYGQGGTPPIYPYDTFRDFTGGPLGQCGTSVEDRSDQSRP